MKRLAWLALAALPGLSQVQTSVSLATSPNPSTYGQPVSFMATVTCGTFTATGTVIFLDGATQLASPVDLSGGQGSMATPLLTQGSHSLTAQYSGDLNCSPSTSTPVNQTVNPVGPPTPGFQAALSDTLLLFGPPAFSGATESVAAGTGLTGPRFWTFGMVNEYPGGTFPDPAMSINTTLVSSSGIIGAIVYSPSSQPGGFSYTTPYSNSGFPLTFTAPVLPATDGFEGTWFANDILGTDTPGFDSTRSVDTYMIPPGGGYQNVTVTVTPRDPRYGDPALAFTKIQVQIQGNCQSIVTSPAYSAPVDCSPNFGAFWTLGGYPTTPSPALNTTYTFTAQMLASNPTGVAVESKPQMTATMTTAYPQATQSTANSVTVADPYLGSVTYSVSSGTPLWNTGPVENLYQVAYPSVDATSVAVTTSANPSVPGQPVTLTATVTNVSAPLASVYGTVEFYDGATLLGTASPPPPGWTFTTSSLAPGPHNITAVFLANWPGNPLADADTVSDTYAGSTSARFTQQVGTPPAFTAPENQTLTATSAAGAVASYTTPTATDAQDGADPVNCTPASGLTFPIGMTIVTCTSTDSSSLTTTHTFTITVADAAPAFTAPANQTFTATGSAGAIATYATPAATDFKDGDDPVICSPASGSMFPIGAATVICASTNSSGMTTTHTFTVTVLPAPLSKCDVNSDGSTNVMDAQLEINEALGNTAPQNDLNEDGVVNVVDVQIDLNAVMGLGCAADNMSTSGESPAAARRAIRPPRERHRSRHAERLDRSRQGIVNLGELAMVSVGEL